MSVALPMRLGTPGPYHRRDDRRAPNAPPSPTGSPSGLPLRGGAPVPYPGYTRGTPTAGFVPRPPRAGDVAGDRGVSRLLPKGRAVKRDRWCDDDEWRRSPVTCAAMPVLLLYLGLFVFVFALVGLIYAVN
jgi:hypothetical protein